MDTTTLTPGEVITPSATSAWIDRSGAFHFVPEQSHYLTAVALSDSTGGDVLLALGWIHLSWTGCHTTRPFTQAQLDTLFDALLAFEQSSHPLRAQYVAGIHQALNSEGQF